MVLSEASQPQDLPQCRVASKLGLRNPPVDECLCSPFLTEMEIVLKRNFAHFIATAQKLGHSLLAQPLFFLVRAMALQVFDHDSFLNVPHLVEHIHSNPVHAIDLFASDLKLFAVNYYVSSLMLEIS